MWERRYEEDVFVNCPLAADYRPVFEAIVFTIHECGYAISDIAGQDIVAHEGKPTHAIRVVRDWLSDATPASLEMPGGTLVARRYELFRRELPALCASVGRVVEELTFNEYLLQVEEWLKANARVPV